MSQKRIDLVLPWYPRGFGGNSRIRPLVKNHAFQSFKADCIWICKEALKGKRPKPAGLVGLQYTPYAPTARKRDEDNFYNAMKAAQDGIAKALGIDDSMIHLLPIVRKESGDFLFFKDAKGVGFVLATLTWEEK